MGYNKITLYDDLSYGYLLLTGEALSSSDILTINTLTTIPQWNSLGRDVFDILANFEETLDSSYIAGIVEPLTGWSVYRQEKGTDELVLVAIVGVDELTIADPLVANSREYIYYVFPETENMIGVSMVSNPIVVSNQWKYSLIKLTERDDGVFVASDFWDFSLNVQSGTVEQSLDITVFETLQKHNKISKGKRNTLNMSITCLLGDINDFTNRYDSDIAKLNAWREFCFSNDKCIWKDRLGDIRIVTIFENPTTQYLDETSEQAQTISFSVKEVMDVSDIQNGAIVSPELTSSQEDKTFDHYQYSASSIWIINHELDKEPEVSIFNNLGEIMIGKIEYPDLKTVIITFTQPVIGVAYLN